MGKRVTEANNPRTSDIDRLSTLEIVARINQEDARVPRSLRKELPHIARAADLMAECLKAGGRVFYGGAGSSGRIGVLDASELPPTYRIRSGQVQAIIAGGDTALRSSVEAAEDDPVAGANAMREAGVQAGDVLVAISASGGAPWVLGAAQEARQRGALVIALVCNRGSALEPLAEVVIAPIVGPEVIAGSTRMKAGSAQKMALNMLSTAAMIRLGKVYGNRMVDMRASNEKLRRRAQGMVQAITGADPALAAEKLAEAGYEVKPVLVMLLAGVDLPEARRRLDRANGFVHLALNRTD